MSAKKWLIAFFATVFGLALALFSFNYLTDPFGAFGEPLLDWYSYDMTNNPRVAKLSYLEEHHEEYDSYIIGPSSTSSFSTQGLNDLYDGNFYNYIMYGSDMLDCEDISRYLIEHYNVENLVLNVYLGAATSYNTESNELTHSQHYLTDPTLSAPSFYWRYLTVNPQYGIQKLIDMGSDTLLTQSFDVFVPETGVYDKSARDVEPIGNLEDYLTAYSEFLYYPSGSLDLAYLEECMSSIAAIKAMCEEHDINFVVVTAPLYYEYVDYYEPDEILEFYTALAEITPFWDFSISSVSYEPRYFYDTTHFRNNVGEMALARMAGDTTTYIPDDFGVWVTTDNVADHFATAIQTTSLTQEEISTQVPILMYHHFTLDSEDSASMTIDGFSAQMEALSQAGYNTVSFDQLLDYVNCGTPLPDNPIIITMDDGYLSNYELAFPVLEEYEMQATIFVIGASVGKDTYKDTDYQMTPHFSYEQGAEMEASGLISIQSHTYDMHQWAPFEESDTPRENILPLEGESEADYIAALTADYLQSKEEIETALGNTVNVLAYPSGKYSDLTQYILQSLGVEVTLSTNPGTNTVVMGLPQTLYAMNRYSIDDSYSPQDLLNLLAEP